MKQLVFIFPLLFLVLFANSQSLQLHYDYRSARNYLTTTLENYALDDFGSTFFFVDFNYSKVGPTEAYWEIARELKTWDGPFSAHLEYNGGLNRVIPLAINNAYLLGGTYSWNTSDFSKGFSLSAMYKYSQATPKPHNVQLTVVWYLNLLNNKLSFTGFADFWTEKHAVFTNEGLKEASVIFLMEPQLWYNISKKISVGSEVETSYQFAGMAGLNVFPTLAVKWSFN